MAHLLGILVLLENIEKKSVFMLKQAQIFNSIEHKFYSIFKIHNRIQRNIGLWIVLPSPQKYTLTRTFENVSVLFLTFLNNYLLNVGSHHIFPPPLVAQTVKNLPAVQETQVHSLDWEVPLQKEVGTHSSILAGEFRGQRSLVHEVTNSWKRLSRFSLTSFCYPTQSISYMKYSLITCWKLFSSLNPCLIDIILSYTAMYYVYILWLLCIMHMSSLLM